MRGLYSVDSVKRNETIWLKAQIEDIKWTEFRVRGSISGGTVLSKYLPCLEPIKIPFIFLHHRTMM